MYTNLTPSSVWPYEGTPLDAPSNGTVPALTLGERALLFVALQAVCLVARADQLMARARPRGGDRRAGRDTSRPGR